MHILPPNRSFYQNSEYSFLLNAVLIDYVAIDSPIISIYNYTCNKDYIGKFELRLGLQQCGIWKIVAYISTRYLN